MKRLILGRPAVDPLTRFMKKVSKTDTCWLWTGGLSKHGYGKFYLSPDKRTCPAHRAAYLLCVGDIPTGKVIMHSCDTPACVNPAHLSIGSNKENVNDCWAKNRHPKNYGACKLKEKTVVKILTMYSDGIKQSEIAQALGLHRSNIHRIVHGITWSRLQQK